MTGRATTSARGHATVDHTADVILEAWGPDLAACCEEAVAALVGTYAVVTRSVGAPTAPPIPGEVVHLAAAPREALLVAVLDEVIFWLDTSRAVPVAAVVSRAADGGLDLRLLLADPDTVAATGSVPKAVSRSNLDLVDEPGRVRCRFLVDI
jgi:SHS2 domain-containing protein